MWGHFLLLTCNTGPGKTVILHFFQLKGQEQPLFNLLLWPLSGHIFSYIKTLCNTRKSYYSSLIEGNNTNLRSLWFLSTIARLKETHSYIEPPWTPLTLSGNDYKSSKVALESTVTPDLYFLSYRSLWANFFLLTNKLSSSKPPTCHLDPIPTRLGCFIFN